MKVYICTILAFAFAVSAVASPLKGSMLIRSHAVSYGAEQQDTAQTTQTRPDSASADSTENAKVSQGTTKAMNSPVLRSNLPKRSASENEGWLGRNLTDLLLGLLCALLLVDITTRFLQKSNSGERTRQQSDESQSSSTGDARQEEKTKQQEAVSQNPVPADSTSPTPGAQPPTTEEKDPWIVVGDSVAGNTHVRKGIPCQDNYYHESLGSGWGIAIVADGKGSASNSHVGSELVARDFGPELFKEVIRYKKWIEKDELPSDEDWHQTAKKVLYKVKEKMQAYVEEEELPFSLSQTNKKEEGRPLRAIACTVIVAIYSPKGILVTHIGDGRAGYKDESGEWKAMMEPLEGEEAGQTAFITSEEVWLSKYIDEYIESRIIREPPAAFALMSDGCEYQAFKCHERVSDDTERKWKPANEPHREFFEPLVKNLRQMEADGASTEEIKDKWTRFLKEGNEKLKEEGDDKTMVLGVSA